MADFFTNRMGNIIVIAPSPDGDFSHIAEYRNIIFYSAKGTKEKALTRWIFADIPKKTLIDDWGNHYDHQVHFLLAGSLAEGLQFISGLKENGFVVEQAEQLFVPFQTLDASNSETSDNLRTLHARAFALARRENPRLQDLLTSYRDSNLISKP